MDALALLIDSFVVYPGLMDLDGPIAGLNLAFWMMAVTHHQTMAILVQIVLVPLDVFVYLSLNGRLKRPAGAIAKNVVENRNCCQAKLK